MEALDLYVRHLALLDGDPAALGSTRVEPAVAAAARSWQTIIVEVEVGRLGVAVGGGLLVSRHMMGGYDRLQTDDPSGDNYVSIASSRPGVTFEIDEAPVWGPYGGFRAPHPFPVFRVRGSSLEPGDVLTLTYGDRAQGMRRGNFTGTACLVYSWPNHRTADICTVRRSEQAPGRYHFLPAGYDLRAQPPNGGDVD